MKVFDVCLYSTCNRENNTLNYSYKNHTTEEIYRNCNYKIMTIQTNCVTCVFCLISWTQRESTWSSFAPSLSRIMLSIFLLSSSFSILVSLSLVTKLCSVMNITKTTRRHCNLWFDEIVNCLKTRVKLKPGKGEFVLIFALMFYTINTPSSIDEVIFFYRKHALLLKYICMVIFK